MPIWLGILLLLLVGFYGVALSDPGKWMDWAGWKAHIDKEHGKKK
jgi:hypothetical protein